MEKLDKIDVLIVEISTSVYVTFLQVCWLLMQNG